MKYRYQFGDVIYDVMIERRGDRYQVTINGDVFGLELLDAQPGALTMRLDGGPAGSAEAGGRLQTVYWAAEGESRWLSSQGCTYRLDRPRQRPRRSQRGPAAATEADLRAPMPAQVRAVQVSEGDQVVAGQTLLLLEAMKMEIRLQSPRPGRVARLHAQPGQTVARDQVLVELAPAIEP